MSVPPRRFRFSDLQITRGALVLGVIQCVLSIGWLALDVPVRQHVVDWVIATPAHVFELGRVWTLITSPLLELDFIGLIFTVVVLAMFAPTLERFWGMARFLRFVAITSVAATLVGCAVGLALGREVGIFGLSPALFAMIVAFGVIYGRQQVTFSFYIRMTGRQMMIAFVVLLVVTTALQGAWEKGAGTVAAMITAAIMTSKRWSPSLAWRRRKIARARAKLTILEGGRPSPKRDEQKWLN